MKEGSEKVTMTDPSLVIAYPPIKRVIKLEIPDEQVEENEENRAFQVVYHISLLLQNVAHDNVITV